MRASWWMVAAMALASAACNRPTDPPGKSVRPVAPMPKTMAQASGDGAVVAAVDPAAAVVARGAVLWTEFKCGLCHGAAGQGYAADFAPSLISESFAATSTDAFITAAITSGRPNTAMGAYGEAYRGPLSPADVTALVAWVRSRRPDVKPLALPAMPAGGDATRGASLYATNCQRCHGDTTTRISAVQLGNVGFLTSASDEYIRYAIVNGRDRTPMVAWQSLLSPTDIEDVVTYIRSWQATLPVALPTPPVAPSLITPATMAATTKPAADRPKAPPITGPVVINPKGKPPVFMAREDRFVPSVQVVEALRTKKKMVIIDARTPADWERTRINGSISVPYYAYELLDKVPKDDTFVLAYCACPHHASGEVVDELRKRGYQHTGIIDEGIIEWEKAGYPVVHGLDGKGAKPAPTADLHAGHAH